MDRFKKARKDCKTLLEQFCWSFKHMNDEKQQPSEFSSEEMENLYRTAYYATLGEDDVHQVKIEKSMERLRNSAIVMRKNNIPLSVICEATGLSEEVVLGL